MCRGNEGNVAETFLFFVNVYQKSCAVTFERLTRLMVWSLYLCTDTNCLSKLSPLLLLAGWSGEGKGREGKRQGGKKQEGKRREEKGRDEAGMEAKGREEEERTKKSEER